MWLAGLQRSALALACIAACGGKSAPHEQPITNSIPVRPSPICEDTVTHYPPVIAPGLMISEESFIERAVRANLPVLRNCYMQRLRYKPSLAGKVTLEMTVGADGKVTHLHTRGFDEEVDRCLCEKLSALTFQTLSGGEVKASYPLYFTP